MLRRKRSPEKIKKSNDESNDKAKLFASGYKAGVEKIINKASKLIYLYEIKNGSLKAIEDTNDLENQQKIILLNQEISVPLPSIYKAKKRKTKKEKKCQTKKRLHKANAAASTNDSYKSESIAKFEESNSDLDEENGIKSKSGRSSVKSSVKESARDSNSLLCSRKTNSPVKEADREANSEGENQEDMVMEVVEMQNKEASCIHSSTDAETFLSEDVVKKQKEEDEKKSLDNISYEEKNDSEKESEGYSNSFTDEEDEVMIKEESLEEAEDKTDRINDNFQAINKLKEENEEDEKTSVSINSSNFIISIKTGQSISQMKIDKIFVQLQNEQGIRSDRIILDRSNCIDDTDKVLFQSEQVDRFSVHLDFQAENINNVIIGLVDTMSNSSLYLEYVEIEPPGSQTFQFLCRRSIGRNTSDNLTSITLCYIPPVQNSPRDSQSSEYSKNINDLVDNVLLNAKQHTVKSILYGSTIHEAVVSSNLSRVKELCELYSNLVYQEDSHGRKPIHLAVENLNNSSNSLEILNYLLDSGPNTSINDLSSEGKAPIHYAIEAGNLFAVQYLKEQLNADISITERSYSNSCLHLALMNHKFQIADYLLQFRSEMNLHNSDNVHIDELTDKHRKHLRQTSSQSNKSYIVASNEEFEQDLPVDEAMDIQDQFVETQDPIDSSVKSDSSSSSSCSSEEEDQDHNNKVEHRKDISEKIEVSVRRSESDSSSSSSCSSEEEDQDQDDKNAIIIGYQNNQLKHEEEQTKSDYEEETLLEEKPQEYPIQSKPPFTGSQDDIHQTLMNEKELPNVTTSKKLIANSSTTSEDLSDSSSSSSELSANDPPSSSLQSDAESTSALTQDLSHASMPPKYSNTLPIQTEENPAPETKKNTLVRFDSVTMKQQSERNKFDRNQNDQIVHEPAKEILEDKKIEEDISVSDEEVCEETSSSDYSDTVAKLKENSNNKQATTSANVISTSPTDLQNQQTPSVPEFVKKPSSIRLSRQESQNLMKLLVLNSIFHK